VAGHLSEDRASNLTSQHDPEIEPAAYATCKAVPSQPARTASPAARDVDRSLMLTAGYLYRGASSGPDVDLIRWRCQ
jgi:hypothetical protein